MIDGPELLEAVKTRIEISIKELLEQKHLYQNININLEDIKEEISKVIGIRHPVLSDIGRFPKQETLNFNAQQPLVAIVNNIVTSCWRFGYKAPLDIEEVIGKELDEVVKNDNKVINIPLPDINIVCRKCKNEPLPHNPGYKGQQKFLANADYEPNNLKEVSQLNSKNIFKGPEFIERYISPNMVQIFFFPYQCQRCKGEPVIFMVRRQGLKLQLVGRSHFEEVVIPVFFPSEESHYYKNAVIAHNTGNPLAGILYLRTFIEQYMRRINNQEGVKITGDELGKEYAKRLPNDFPNRFKGLKKIYDELSVPLHEGKEDYEQFKISKNDILKHFDALRLFPISASN